MSLRDERLSSVQSLLKASGARRVLDLGCGAGALLERLVRDGYEGSSASMSRPAPWSRPRAD